VTNVSRRRREKPQPAVGASGRKRTAKGRLRWITV
jgi:hypothetical protein